MSEHHCLCWAITVRSCCRNLNVVCQSTILNRDVNCIFVSHIIDLEERLSERSESDNASQFLSFDSLCSGSFWQRLLPQMFSWDLGTQRHYLQRLNFLRQRPERMLLFTWIPNTSLWQWWEILDNFLLALFSI